MWTYLAIALFGVLGCWARFAQTNLVQAVYGREFPYATLSIDLLGSFLMGFLFIDTLERLIADLFDFTRLEYLEQTPKREPLDLGELLQRSAEGASAEAEAKSVHLNLISGDAGRIDADPHMLQRAIENVLDNAIRHTPSGGAITLEQGRRDGVAWFRISDSGPGIDPADLPHIFTPLYRSDASRNSRTGGAGLGLSIARSMLRAHGGDLPAAHRAAGGAVFEGTISA